MFSKKGQGISVNYIVIIALALIVLIVIAIYFTGGLDFLLGQQTTIIRGSVSDQQKNIWRGNCRLWCNLGSEESFYLHVFNKGDDPEIEQYVCNDARINEAEFGNSPNKDDLQVSDENCAWSKSTTSGTGSTTAAEGEECGLTKACNEGLSCCKEDADSTKMICCVSCTGGVCA